MLHLHGFNYTKDKERYICIYKYIVLCFHQLGEKTDNGGADENWECSCPAVMMITLILCGFLWLIQIHLAFQSSDKAYVLNLVILSPEKDVVQNALDFLADLRPDVLSKVNVTLSVCADSWRPIKWDETFGIRIHRSRALPDLRMGASPKMEDFVSPLLESMLHVTSIISTGQLVTLAFHKSLRLFPKRKFMTIYNALDVETSSAGQNNEQPKVYLPEKAFSFKSQSDWHDMLFVGMTVCNLTRRWLSSVFTTFMGYANRPAYPMLEPRPALLEAALEFRVVIDFNTGKVHSSLRLAHRLHAHVGAKSRQQSVHRGEADDHAAEVAGHRNGHAVRM